MPRMTQNEKEIKNKRLAKALIKHKGDRAKAWCELHPQSTKSSAIQSAYRYMAQHPEVAQTAMQLANENGLPATFFLKQLKKLSNAKKTIIYNNELVKVDDNTTQATMVKEGLKLHRLVQPDNSTITSNNYTQVNITQQVTDKLLSRLDAVLGNLNELRSEHMPNSVKDANGVEDAQFVDEEVA